MANRLSEDEDYKLWVLLNQTRDAVYNVRQRRLQACDVTLEQASILFTVGMHGGRATPTQISQWVIRRHHTVLGILDRMQKVGLLKRSKGLENKNRVEISMTEKGWQTLGAAANTEGLRNIMACLSDEDRHHLFSSLTRLRFSALEQAGALGKPEYP